MTVLIKKPKPIGQVLRRATDTRQPVFQSKERAFEMYAGFSKNCQAIFTNLRHVAKRHMGIDLQLPTVPVLASDVAAMSFQQALDFFEETIENVAYGVRQAFVDQGVGILEASETSDVWAFSFKDFERRRGILRDTLSHTPHRHIVAHARLLRLGDRDVRLPPRAVALVADLLPCLRSELRVVTGTKVVEEIGQRHDRREWTPFGKGLVNAGHAAVSVAPVAGAAVLVGAGVYGAVAAAASMAAAATVFVADPVLVLSDLCLFGWDD